MSKKIRLATIIAALALIIFAFIPQILHFLSDYLWFGEVGYRSVFLTFTFAKFGIGIAVFLIVFLLSYSTLQLSTKRKISPEEGQAQDAAPASPKRLRIYLITFPSAFLGLLAGYVSATALWQEILLFLNQEAAGVADPVFGLDISFYFFTLSLLETVFDLAVLFLAVIALFNFLLTGYLQGFHKQTFVLMGKRMTGFLVAFFVLAAIGFVLKAFNLLYTSNETLYGAGYVALKVSLPTDYAAAVCCLISALGILIGMKKKKIRPTLLGPVLLIGVLAIGTLAEGTVEKFIVRPAELTKEAPYISRNIEMTNQAYGLDSIEERTFAAEDNLTLADLQDNLSTVQNIRITDYRPSLQIFNQLQVLRYYYNFTDIDIDRYQIGDTQRQVFIAARELDQSAFTNQTWINRYLKYTHGYGAVVTPVNEITSQGQPQLWVKNLPPKSSKQELTITQPEIYFGELTTDYVIVNTSEAEFDYPIGDSNAETNYAGSAGIPLNFQNRILFSLNHTNYRILFSNLINHDSRILLYRNVCERAAKIAPFLIYDNDPYLVINNEGKLFWIMDAYTSSDKYPYSILFDDAASRFHGKNYVRNSVKITVDAYNGTTNFYIVDESDPIIQSYANIFPGLFQPIAQMPEDLRSHLQYPTAMFDLQTRIYENYHMKNATVFYNREDAWSIATELYADGTITVEPYYVNMCLPKSDELEYLLMRPFTAYQKDNMVAWLAVRNDDEHYGEMIVFKFPKQSLIYGPMQIESRISNDSEISQNLALWDQQGSSVIRGDLLVIPINESILYVEPIYLTASNANSLPEVIRIIVAYEDRIVMAKTLDAALQELFGGAVEYNPQGNIESVTIDDDIIGYDDLIQQIQTALTKAKAASQAGDWAEYGKYMDQLEQYIDRLTPANAAINDKLTDDESEAEADLNDAAFMDDDVDNDEDHDIPSPEEGTDRLTDLPVTNPKGTL